MVTKQLLNSLRERYKSIGTSTYRWSEYDTLCRQHAYYLGMSTQELKDLVEGA
ncbi:hypothetical protein [Bacillus cereus]|uniref:hypothetical protein n=1 Tax=Bacillus cereus TaxID=1396 RepID=UPI003CF85425